MTNEPVLHHYKKVPRRFEEGAQQHRYISPEDRYGQAYFEDLDLGGGEIEKRFDQSDCEVESLLIDAANNKGVTEIPENVAKYFQDKIDLMVLPFIPRR